MPMRILGLSSVGGIAVLVAACAHVAPPPANILGPARGGALAGCADLAGRLAFPATAFTAATPVAAGELQVAGSAVAAHCRVTG